MPTPRVVEALNEIDDRDEIDRAIDEGAQRVTKNLVRHLNYQLHRAPELRRTRNGPSTPFSDLLEQYPIGLHVTVEHEGERHQRLLLRFQNKSGVMQPTVNLLVLIPIPLRAAIGDSHGEIQEEKYNRFVIDYPDANLPDRGLLDGPTIDLTVPCDVAPDLHIFFRVIAGDSQVTKTPKVTEFLPTVRG